MAGAASTLQVALHSDFVVLAKSRCQRFFAEITGKRIRRSSKAFAELEAAIHDYIAKNNASPKPFVWTKTAKIILEKNERARAVLCAVKSGSQALKSEH